MLQEQIVWWLMTWKECEAVERKTDTKFLIPVGLIKKVKKVNEENRQENQLNKSIHCSRKRETQCLLRTCFRTFGFNFIIIPSFRLSIFASVYVCFFIVRHEIEKLTLKRQVVVINS
ncbi:CLUMA_CG003094, isoform A [Clunio marinus]|uniref:CLUMA_CG003094, isoform A n=1 Tax=Clunio marinus TaxID=568069 RepID=A0A1J1HMQ5_9DIPT|nr:CLUMA_CG003094, isoform A [Clunio marinus]